MELLYFVECGLQFPEIIANTIKFYEFFNKYNTKELKWINNISEINDNHSFIVGSPRKFDESFNMAAVGSLIIKLIELYPSTLTSNHDIMEFIKDCKNFSPSKRWELTMLISSNSKMQMVLRQTDKGNTALKEAYNIFKFIWTHSPNRFS